jgi:uncharacterized protein YrzB (UPF0473 family)
MDKETMIVVDEQGNEIECEIVLTFKNDQFNKSYVIYAVPGDEEDLVTASSYDEDATDGGELQPIESDEEWDMIEEVLSAFQDEEE